MCNKIRLTPMHVSASADQIKALTFLYCHGGNIDCEDDEGQIPLHWACY